MEKPVTVLGLGAMGQALATALLEAGHPTTVWNRTRAKADTLAEKGAGVASTAAEAVAASPLVVVCLLDYNAVREVLASVSASGKTLVNLTNGTPAEARETAEWAAGQGSEYVDGGIMAVPAGIGQPESILLYSGCPAAFARHRDVLDTWGNSTFLGPDPGLAALYDLALLSAMYGMFAGFGSAVAMVGSEPVDFTRTLLVPWLTAMVAILPWLAEQPDVTDDARKVQQAALTNILRAAEARGIDSAVMAPIRAIREHS